MRHTTNRNEMDVTKKRDEDGTVQKLDLIVELLRQSLAVQLYKSGASKEAIGKHLHVAKASVVKMLKGVSREERNGGRSDRTSRNLQ
jgi:hypothetical protein